LTNTFGANRLRLAGGGGADRVKEINEAGTRISREAANKCALVLARLGQAAKCS